MIPAEQKLRDEKALENLRNKHLNKPFQVLITARRKWVEITEITLTYQPIADREIAPKEWANREDPVYTFVGFYQNGKARKYVKATLVCENAGLYTHFAYRPKIPQEGWDHVT